MKNILLVFLLYILVQTLSLTVLHPPIRHLRRLSTVKSDSRSPLYKTCKPVCSIKIWYVIYRFTDVIFIHLF